MGAETLKYGGKNSILFGGGFKGETYLYLPGSRVFACVTVDWKIVQETDLAAQNTKFLTVLCSGSRDDDVNVDMAIFLLGEFLQSVNRTGLM